MAKASQWGLEPVLGTRQCGWELPPLQCEPATEPHKRFLFEIICGLVLRQKTQPVFKPQTLTSIERIHMQTGQESDLQTCTARYSKWTNSLLKLPIVFFHSCADRGSSQSTIMTTKATLTSASPINEVQTELCKDQSSKTVTPSDSDGPCWFSSYPLCSASIAMGRAGKVAAS